MGGPTQNRNSSPIQLLKVWSDELGRYKDPIGYIVAGVVFRGVSVLIRQHKWKIEFKKESAEGALEFCQ